jgi:hypothetical protein
MSQPMLAPAIEDLLARQHSARLVQTAEKLQEAVVDQNRQIPALISIIAIVTFRCAEGEGPERTRT